MTGPGEASVWGGGMGVGFGVAVMVIMIGLGPQQDALEFFGNKMKPRQWVSGRETAAPKKSKADEAAEFLANAHEAPRHYIPRGSRAVLVVIVAFVGVVVKGSACCRRLRCRFLFYSGFCLSIYASMQMIFVECYDWCHRPRGGLIHL